MSQNTRSRSLSATAARGALTTITGQWTKFLLQTISIAVLSRLLAPGDFGLLTMLTAIVGVANLLGDFGLSMASIQSQTITDAQRSKLFWTNTALGALLTCIVCACAVPISALYGEPRLVLLALVVSPVFLLNGVTAQWKAVSGSRLRFTAMAVADVSAQALSLVIGIAAALLGFGYWALAAQQLGLALATCIGMAIASGWMPHRVWRAASIREFTAFGVNTMGVQLINYISSNADSVIIGRVLGAASLGFYDRAYQLFRIPLLQLAAPMARVALPVLSRMQDDPRFEAYVLRAQKILAYSMGGFFFWAGALAAPLIEVVLGPQWNESKSVLTILAVGGVFQALAFVYYWVFLAKALTGIQFRIAIVTRGLMVVAMIVSVQWGIVGVAAAGASGLALNWLALTVIGVPRLGLSRRAIVGGLAAPVGVLLASALAAAGTSMLLITGLPAIVELMIGSVAFFAVAAAAAVLPPVRRDYRDLVDTLKRVRGA